MSEHDADDAEAFHEWLRLGCPCEHDGRHTRTADLSARLLCAWLTGYADGARDGFEEARVLCLEGRS